MFFDALYNKIGEHITRQADTPHLGFYIHPYFYYLILVNNNNNIKSQISQVNRRTSRQIMGKLKSWAPCHKSKVTDQSTQSISQNE